MCAGRVDRGPGVQNQWVGGVVDSGTWVPRPKLTSLGQASLGLRGRINFPLWLTWRSPSIGQASSPRHLSTAAFTTILLFNRTFSGFGTVTGR